MFLLWLCGQSGLGCGEKKRFALAVFSNAVNIVFEIRLKTDIVCGILHCENAEGHIPGAIRIADSEITERAPVMLPDRDKLILVYCRSGRRSKNAAAELVKLGYTNIKEFGGIIDWPYETEKN